MRIIPENLHVKRKRRTFAPETNTRNRHDNSYSKRFQRLKSKLLLFSLFALLAGGVSLSYAL